MSHFITNTYDLQDQPVIKPINTTITYPALTSIQRQYNSSALQQSKERSMLKKIFFHIKNEQYERLHEQNALSMARQFKELKRKLKLKALKEQSSIQNIINGKQSNQRLNIAEIVAMNPTKIDLLKKYQSKVQLKLNAYHESESIRKGKESYQTWADNTYNDLTSSPIFSKLTFLLEKCHAVQRKSAVVVGASAGAKNDLSRINCIERSTIGNKNSKKEKEREQFQKQNITENELTTRANPMKDLIGVRRLTQDESICNLLYKHDENYINKRLKSLKRRI